MTLTTPQLCARLLMILSVMTVPTSRLLADSIEKIPITPEDIARELGIEMDKFEARFDTPVYATLRLLWKKPGDAEARAMEHTSMEPDQYHEIMFVRKDFGQIQLKTGGGNAKQVRDVIEMNVRFGSTGFFYRDINPFAKLEPGQSLQSWSKQQSREPLPLDERILLVIAAGPMEPDKPVKNLLEDYRSSPAFISLSVTFSTTPPTPPDTAGIPAPDSAAAPAPAPGAAPATPPAASPVK